MTQWFTGDFLRQANQDAKEQWDRLVNQKDSKIKVINPYGVEQWLN